MKHLSKSFLAFLALTLFGGAGAWAQGPTTVFEVDFSSNPATATTGSMWIGNSVYTSTVKINGNVNTINTIRMAADYNYSNNKYFSIKPETGSFQTGDTLLIAVCYNFNGTKTSKADIYAANGTTLLFTTAPGINGHDESGNPVVEKFVLEQDADSLLIGANSSNTAATNVTTLKVLRPAGGGAIELTKVGANQWSLAETPDYDLELQVEYYEPNALKEIPAGWQIKVNGVGQTSAVVGDSLMITETDSVTLIPDNPRRVKSVTLVDEAPAPQTVNIDGVDLLIAEGDTWQQIVDRNPGVIWVDGDGHVRYEGAFLVDSDLNTISASSTYDSTIHYDFY